MDIPSPVKGLSLLLLALLLSFSATGVIHAQSPDAPGPEQPLGYDEAEAYSINQMIMCPVCPAETIDQAQVPIARQMRQIVREMLTEGATREEILEFFAQRYGKDILASPPKSGFNLVAWVFPFVGVAAALVAGLLVLRSMSTRKVEVAVVSGSTSAAQQELEPYLDMVDRELARRGSPAASSRESLEPDESELATRGVEPQREGGPNRDG